MNAKVDYLASDKIELVLMVKIPWKFGGKKKKRALAPKSCISTGHEDFHLFT